MRRELNPSSFIYGRPPGRESAERPPQFEPSEAVCQEWSQVPAWAAGE